MQATHGKRPRRYLVEQEAASAGTPFQCVRGEEAMIGRRALVQAHRYSWSQVQELLCVPLPCRLILTLQAGTRTEQALFYVRNEDSHIHW